VLNPLLLIKLVILKTGLFFILFIFAFKQGNTQQDTSALFKRFPVVPPFSLMKTDSGWITKDGLKKNHPLIIMYFSPGCHHCVDQMEDMLKRKNDFNEIQILLATYQPLEELRAFEQKYKLYDYPNIQSGRDTKYFLQPFYRIRNLPYLALYDKKGKLVTTFEGNVKVDQLVGAFK